MTNDLDLSFLGLDEQDRQILTEGFERMIRESGGNVESLVTFGSAASEGFDLRRSDINLIVVLRRDGRADLDALRPHLAVLMRQFKVSPMITTREELASSADVFPVKFLDIQEQHRVIHGPDPFSGLVIGRDHVRLRCEQELKNMALRLRRQVVSRVVGSPASVLRETIRGVLPAFTSVLRALLGLRGVTVGADRADVLSRAAAELDLPAEVMERLVDLGRGRSPADDGAMEDLAHDLLTAVVTAAAAADRMDIP
jgi:predicted nucleotidyltransferase